jgi:hypothetical protein
VVELPAGPFGQRRRQWIRSKDKNEVLRKMRETLKDKEDGNLIVAAVDPQMARKLTNAQVAEYLFDLAKHVGLSHVAVVREAARGD